MLDLLQACDKNRQQDHSAIIAKLREFQSEVSHEQIQNQILQTLRFDGMYSREDNTSEATEGTFRWLLVKNKRFEKRYVRSSNTIDKMQITREAFLTWLESGEGVFHVCGKAGSGKSTLMKLICTNSRTRDGLNTWAADDTLLHASFFFFAPGEKEAKSLTGLYRCLLFTILNEHRDLMSKVYPDECLHDRPPSPQFLDLLRPQRLEKAIQSLIDTAATGAYKMCIFIDGLDEYEGSFTDYWQLADRLLGWADQSSGRVKFCVSSRPEVQFVKTFGSRDTSCIRQIHLHEFTSGDIEKHCYVQFASSTWFKGSDMVPNYDKFIDQIVSRAEGVFLWAVLVTKVLLYEARKDGFERDLWRRLEEIPDDINALYDKLFESMGQEQQRKCNLILQTVMTNPFREPLNARSLNLIYDEEDLDQALLQQQDEDRYVDHEREESRVTDNLTEWTRGLVETIPWNQAVSTRNAWGTFLSPVPSSTTSIDEDSTSQNPTFAQRTVEDHSIGTEDTSTNMDGNILEDSDSYETVDPSFDSGIYVERRILGETPLFRTRVRLFHKTVKDYILHSTSFRKVQSDFSDFNVMETHAKLRLLELGPVSNNMPNSWPREICDYIHEILEMDFGDSVSSDRQIPWSICKTIGLLIPTSGYITLGDLKELFNPSPYQTPSRLSKEYVKETSFPHLAAFFGHAETLEEAKCVPDSSHEITKNNERPQPGPNLLLSACLGIIIHSGDSIHTEDNGFGTITKALQLGSSGHDHMTWFGKGESVTVWQLLIFALALVDLRSSSHIPSSVDRLLKIIAQLLGSESQEDVLILLTSLEDGGSLEEVNLLQDDDSLKYAGFLLHRDAFSSFITIQDAVESFPQSEPRDSLLRQLNDGPQYDMEEPPAWVYALLEVPDSHRQKAQKSLQRMAPDDYLQWRKANVAFSTDSVAVVSNGGFLEGGRLLSGDCSIPLW